MNACRWLLSTAVVCTCCLLVCSSAAARVWTDKQGRTINARFVRVVGLVGVFQLPSGKVVQLPLEQLSEDDQKYLKQHLASQGIRMWTSTEGSQMLGRYLRVRDGTVYVKSQQKTAPLGFTNLAIADRLWVRAKAEENGQSDQLPPPTAEEELPEARTWTDTEGNSGEGRLDRVLPDGRVLLAVDGATRVVDIKKLTAVDHDYLREELAPQGLAHLVPRKPEPTASPATAVPPRTSHIPSRPPGARSPRPRSVPVRPPPRVSRPAAPPSPSPRSLQRPLPQTRAPRPYTPPRVDFTPVTPVRILKCSKCGRQAPPGAKLGEPCTYCSKRVSPYKLGRTVGMVGGILALVAFVGGLIWRGISG